MSAPVSEARISWLPVAWAVGWIVILGLAFFSISWPYIDLHSNLRAATDTSWPQYVRYAFTRGVEYRPFLTLGLKGAYEVAGLHLWVYQLLVMAQLAAVLGLLTWLFRPIGTRRALAAIVALSCVLGLHTSRILFLFVPVNAHSGALVLLLAALALALHPRTRPFDWIYLPLTTVALFTLESSLLIVPLLVVLWWFEAPGVSLRGVAGAVVAFLLYLFVRFTFGAAVSLESSYVGSGLGFSDATPETLRNVFEHAPWLFWIYNVSASLLTVVASEPRAGAYRFVEALLRGGAPLWQWLHVLSSVLTTTVVIAVLATHRLASERDRLLVVAGVLLVVLGSGLGFLYTRDRIALSAGVGYTLLVFVALAMLLERLPAAAWKRVSVVGVVGILFTTWTTRAAETYVQLRDTAWDYHLEWTERWDDIGGSAQPRTELLTTLRSTALRASPANPRGDPAWTFVVFQRRFDPAGGSRRSADDAADNAVVPLSLPFDIRWKPEVDETRRREAEAELGLAEPQQVARDPRGRTWEYRLRMPTRDRVEMVIRHAAVEDTGRIDRQRFEVVQ
jgi:hypothetical protein